ncbi:sugar ABC transporter permease [Micromonospora sp. NPDC023966]|uniref:carbohydrate ABC transporter permease n=1 Tax=Micromonospora sp. NPDC023966 TaxID=3154699 RepID=UPI0033F4447E
MTSTEVRSESSNERRSRGSRQRRQRQQQRREAYLLLVPALIPVLIFSVYPLLNGIYLGFTDSRAGFNRTTHFTGFENYVRLLDNSRFWESFKIGLVWAFGVTAIQFLLALGLALLLNQRLRMRWLVRTLALVPWAMPSVIVAIMWRLVYHPDAGLLNDVLTRMHLINENINWLADFSFALPAVIAVGVWAGMPQTTVTLLAGLQGVPGELHEAGAVDGATAWQRFWHVTLPQLRPVIVAITSLDFVWNFNSFGLVYVLTEGGPGGKTMLPMLFAYNEGFKYGNFGYAAAMGNAMVVLIIGLMAFYLWSRMREAA